MSVVYPKRVKTIKKAGDTALSGDVTLTGGTNVTLTQSGQDISIAATGGANHNVLSATHSDSTVGTVVRGDIITGQGASPTWSRLAVGGANTVLHGSATEPAYSAVVEGDITLADNTTNNVSTTKHGFTPKAPNTTTDFLRGDATWAAPAGGGVPLSTYASIFETSGRFSSDVNGGGTSSYGTAGVLVTSSATGGSWKADYLNVTGDFSILANTNRQFACDLLRAGAAPSDGDSFFGTGYPSQAVGGMTYTVDQFGFKIVYAVSSATISATNSQGTSETATSFVISENLRHIWYAKLTGSTNIKFWTATGDGGARTLQATHTTNLPNGAPNAPFVVVANNKNVATNFQLRCQYFTLSEDATT